MNVIATGRWPEFAILTQAEQAFFEMGNGAAERDDGARSRQGTPLPPVFVNSSFLMDLRERDWQIPLCVGLTGKFVLTKELGGAAAKQKPAGKVWWVVDR